MHGWGGVAITFGSLSLLYAAVAIPIGLLVNATNSDGSPNGTRNAVLYSGIGTLIGGVALLALGIPLVAVSNTHVTTDTGRDLARIHFTPTGMVF
jgi:hypothetical protein